jgi:hypothetical protein
MHAFSSTEVPTGAIAEVVRFPPRGPALRSAPPSPAAALGLRRRSLALLCPLVQEWTLAPGERFEGSLLLHNPGEASETVRVCPRDFACAANGTSVFARPNTLPRSNAAWYSVDTAPRVIGPGETTAFAYRGRMMAAAGQGGTFWSLLMVEHAAPADPGQPGLRTLARYGVQVVTHAGATGRRSVRIIRRHFVCERGAGYGLFDVENDGEAQLFSRVALEVFTPVGARIGRYESESVRLCPGWSARQRVDLSGLKPGAYHAQLQLDAGPGLRLSTRIVFAL